MAGHAVVIEVIRHVIGVGYGSEITLMARVAVGAGVAVAIGMTGNALLIRMRSG